MTKPDAAGEQGEQACVPALLEFLGMVPELAEASVEDAPGSVLAGCEHDCKHLAFKALSLLQQVPSFIHQSDDCHAYPFLNSSHQFATCCTRNSICPHRSYSRLWKTACTWEIAALPHCV